ncbi:MAG: surface carbohydrate biosynthesis protein [Oscillospiraceae bacterium]|nr:surface carbohydrate biosynthesis protein [Oscillospiraceae bacterium]
MALDFLFLYEHIVREFENDCLVMAELERRGYSSELFQLMDRKKLKYFTWKKPKVIVTSAMYDNETLNSFVYNNVGKLQKVVNLHWEEVLSREQEDSDFYSLTQNARRCTHICWGEAAKKRIVSKGVPENNAVVTGAVQLDFLYPMFDGYFKSRDALAQQFGLDPDRRWLCYISSFSCAWMDDKEVAELNEMTDLDFAGFKAVGARSMRATLAWFDRLLDEMPDIELIYRPHPSEWQSPPLEAMKQKHPHFHVISDYSVKQWVKCCDTLLTWMSTSIAEVYFAKKSCLVLRPEPLHDDYDPVTYEGCDAIADYDALKAALARDKVDFPIDEARLRAHYDVDPEYPAYMRVADLLEWTLKNPPRDLPFSQGYTPRFNAAKFFVLFALKAMNTLHVNPHWFDFLSKKLTDQTERLMNYYKKARVSKRAVRAKTDELRGYIDAADLRPRAR